MTAVAQHVRKEARTIGAGARLRIASVCTVLPTRRAAHHGVFVQRRLTAMGQHADVQIVRPVPWFPFLRPMTDGAAAPEVLDRRMFYLPGVLKSFDGRWLQRAVQPVLASMKSAGTLDVIDAHFGYPEGVGCVLAGRELGVPVFVTVRGNEILYLRRFGIGRRLLDALRSATGIVCVSESLRDVLRRHGLDDGRIRVIPNGVDESRFRPVPRDVARRRLGQPLHGTLIVSVGRVEKAKGPHTLVRAVAALRRSGFGVRLALIGDDETARGYVRGLRDLVARLGLRNAVHFAGRRPPDEIPDWLAAADAFALASRREGCCNAVLEALACGTPVVATPVGDNARYVHEGVNGHVAAVENAAAFEAALGEVLSRTWNAEDVAASVRDRTWASVGAEAVDWIRTRLAS